MGQHPIHIPQPKEYWIPNFLDDDGDGSPPPFTTVDHLQFVPGVVVGVVTGRDSEKYEGDLRRIGSIRALPHIGTKGLKKKSMVGEESRYYPLLRGMQEAPTPGDPVLLCEFGGVQYYLGPINPGNNPNFNIDKFAGNEIRSGKEQGTSPEGKTETRAFIKQDYSRLQKLLNNKLDNPINPDGELSKVIHGDLIFEGRHGNSIRIGSRNINPYLIISNGRLPSNPAETTLDGTILGIFKQGRIRDHFNIDNKGGEKYNFILADDEIEEVKRSISKTFTKPLARGLVDKPENTDNNINETIYGYSSEQLFLSSGRITFNARSDSIFISAFQHIHMGSGNSMTFSTSQSFLVEAATRVGINTPLFKVNSDTAAIDGRKAVILGAPELGDNPNHAVCGDALVDALNSLKVIIQSLAMGVVMAVENRAKAGGSMDYMNPIMKDLNNWYGKNGEKLEKQILSKRVYISPY